MKPRRISKNLPLCPKTRIIGMKNLMVFPKKNNRLQEEPLMQTVILP